MRDRAVSDSDLIVHFSHLSGPGEGWLFSHLIIARKSASVVFLGHWKGSFSTRALTSVTDNVSIHGFGSSGMHVW